MATGQVSITWKDAAGKTFTNAFTIESPTIEEVRKAFTNPMMMPPPSQTQTETDEEFYGRISLQMVNQVMYQVQQQKQQQAMAAVPVIEVTPIEAPAARGGKPV